MPLKIVGITGTRADWGLLSPPLILMKDDPVFDIHVIATGQHMTDRNGGSLDAIRADGFDPIKIDMHLNGDDAKNITASLGNLITALATTLDNLKPDLMIVVGDRYEILGAVQAALLFRIPVAHLYGGDITEGAFDDSIRHAITKLSHIHFPTNEDSTQRLRQLGESNIYTVGSTGLDNLKTMKFLDRTEFFKKVGLEGHEKNLIVTFHPVTLENNSREQCAAMLSALATLDSGIILTGSNADPEGAALTKMKQDFAASHTNAVFHQSLGHTLYFNALKHCDAMIGNSSSGLYEAPSFDLPTINIGTRQQGRLRAASVIDVPPDTTAIRAAIKTALQAPRRPVKNPYGEGDASAKIVEILKNLDNPAALCKKSFVTVDCGQKHEC